MSIIGNQIWYLLPHRRTRKAKQNSTMWGFVDAVGEVLDTLKLTILIARLRRYFLVRTNEETEDYYTSDERTLDLEAHGRDRGLMRLPGERSFDKKSDIQNYHIMIILPLYRNLVDSPIRSLLIFIIKFFISDPCP